MPFYEYVCEKCDKKLTIRHGMDDEVSNCDGQEQVECDASSSGSLKRYYGSSSSFYTELDEKETDDRKETGDLVKEFIEEEKRELKKKKDKMSKEEFNIEEKTEGNS